MEFADLSPYEFLPHPLPMLNVGWLGERRGVPGGGAVVPGDLLRAASRRVAGLTLGWHECEFCPVDDAAKGNGEYRYYTPGGAVYVAPVLVLHYVEVHGYRPPSAFLRDLAAGNELTWDERAEWLAAVLVDGSAELEWRAQAAGDLLNWHDSRALRAGLEAAQDAELADVAGDKLGFLIGALWPGVRAADFPDFVRIGITQALAGIEP